MFYAVVQLYSNTTIEAFKTEQDAIDHLTACSQKGVSFGLGYVDSRSKKICLAARYELLPEGPGKQTVNDIIRAAYQVHQKAVKGK